MPVRIPLPNVARAPDAAAHPYPFQISIQTLEFLQASLFYAAFVDVATGELVRQPDGMARIEKQFTEKLYTKETYDQVWGFLAKYQPVFDRVPFQSVLISLNSHWDWYLRKLVDFILFARANTGADALSNESTRRLERSGMLPLLEQIEIVELSAGVQFGLTDQQRVELQEMALVRNLGLHNRWELDARYLEKTQRQGLQPGELRLVAIDELHQWHHLLMTLVHESASRVAVAFVAAPDYP